MFAEVITGRFKDEGANPYSLPASAQIGLPVLDRAHGVKRIDVYCIQSESMSI